MSKSLIASFSSKILVEAFNNLGAIIDKEEINKFSSIAVGVKRTEALFDKVNEYRAANDLPLVAFVEGGKLVNVEPPAPVVVPQEVIKPAKIVAAKPKVAKKAPGRVAAVAPSDVILMKVAEGHNPKRAVAAERFAKYASGITVADYIAAIGGDRKQALRDICWDVKQGWIGVVGAKSKEAKAAQAPKVDVAADAPAEQKLLAAPAAMLMLAAPVAQATAA